MIIVDPDPQALAEYRLRQHQWELERQKLKRLRGTRAATLDNVEVELHANIELPGDVEQVLESGATGIGLFRTEFLFLNRDNLPDEDEQFEAYRRVVREMDGLPVTIRTYDLGADKQINESATTSQNPALGLRAIRLSLSEPPMFLAQLRALLRASHYGKLRILIPMLMSAAEINQTLAFIAQARQQLENKFIPYDREVTVGGMIEVPAAALAIQTFTKQLRLSVDRHQRPDPVHARDRPHRRRGIASLRSAAPGRHQPDRERHQGLQQGGHAGRAVRRDGRRRAAHAPACWVSACASFRCTRRACSRSSSRS